VAIQPLLFMDAGIRSAIALAATAATEAEKVDELSFMPP
jgi:hypothetical protein